MFHLKIYNHFTPSAFFYNIPFVDGITPSRRGSICVAKSNARAQALNNASA
jgi:hypothetical protein